MVQAACENPLPDGSAFEFPSSIDRPMVAFHATLLTCRMIITGAPVQPFGYFVHHQGRGHAQRCAAIANALPNERPIMIFCARDDIFPPLPANAIITLIPSLFERRGDEKRTMEHVPTPRTLHCAPLGWPSIRQAMATITAWFHAANPALMICDVSAEIAQLTRICSVPHVKILQHGDRGDVGHQAAYDGAVGLLAPFHAALAQPEWAPAMLNRTCFAGGLGINNPVTERVPARRRIGVGQDERLVVVVAGGGGSGFSQAPLAVGARSQPAVRWITIGPLERDWHATDPSNIEHRGWASNASDYIAAADLVIASTGNTTCQEILVAARPWLAIPEWRYFDEQHRKAEVLAAAGVATVRQHLPSSADAWRVAMGETISNHNPERQREMIEYAPAAKVAGWLETLAATLWQNCMPNLVQAGIV